ncbi:hypothetical protein RJ640_027889 [Escallonia rubra]|uniref:Chromo domain-containing protein n=1 Tax=Escallonia rubra TaxID=112253 RepID=A0AA88RDU2_9ASTE|nr:hypothetical protein RJ640_027889 [Escallonia rubra]
MLEYRVGSTNNVADALNRRTELVQLALTAMNAIVRADSRVAINIGKKIKKALTKDSVAQQLLKLVESGKSAFEIVNGQQPIPQAPQEYLVRWQGYTEEENTWERAANLSAYNDKIEAYRMQKLMRASTTLVGENVMGCPLGTKHDKHSAPAPIQHTAYVPSQHNVHAPMST